jgi:hypothetical protein
VKLLPFVSRQRECGDCTKCCEGWNVFNIDGKSVKPGSPCKFVEIGKGCSIYDVRPAYPCKSYNCEWKLDSKIPEEFKPSVSGVIIHKMCVNDIHYYIFVPSPNDPTEEMIKWGKKHFDKKNFVHYDEENVYPYGEEDFTKMIHENTLSFINDHHTRVISITKNL